MKALFSASTPMKNRARVRITITAFAIFCLLGFAFIQLPRRSQAVQSTAQTASTKRRIFVPGEVLVRYKSESLAEANEGTINVHAPDGALMLARVEHFDASKLVSGLRKVRVDPDATLDAVAAFNKRPDVLYAEPNYILHGFAGPPNDPFFSQGLQYGPGKIGADQVWANFNQTGSNSVVVAVIDQGIEFNHQDLAANMWTNPGESANGVDDDGNGCIDDLHGCNFLESPSTGNVFSGDDGEYHATHVAGIIGAVGNNGIGVTGVNWTTRLMSLKFLDPDNIEGDAGAAIVACNYVAQMRDLWDSTGGAKGANVRVVNASFGGSEYSQVFIDALTGLNARGILFVAAAGNIDDGTREPNNDLIPQYPASFNTPNIISVAATDNLDQLVERFSHFGAATVHLGAPGAEILSTTPPCSDPGDLRTHPCDPLLPVGFTPTQDTYSIVEGTSMAAPQVSGAAALLWAQNPNLTAQQVKQLLLLNGDPQPSLIDKTLSGRRLNVFKSFQALQEADSTPPGPVTNLHLNFQNGRTFSIGWTAGGDDGPGGPAAALYEVSFIDGGTQRNILLKGVVPAAPNTAQSTSLTIPYRHTAGKIRLKPIDNKGNEGAVTDLPVGIPALSGDPYVVTVDNIPSPPLTTGGTRLFLDGDDRYAEDAFPTGFVFPFFGSNFTEATISTNGNIFFSDPPRRQRLPNNNADDPPGSPNFLGGYQMIAGLWSDLEINTTKRTDAGVFLRPISATRIVYRWQATKFGCVIPCTPINFEIELNTDGTIRTRYGDGNTNVRSTVGIGGGNQDGYVVPTYSVLEGTTNLTNASQVTFAPLSQWSPIVLTDTQVELKSWTQGGRTFVYAKLNFPDAGFRVTDWGTPTRSGNDFSVNTSVERFNGASAQVISNTAQIWDLGTLTPGTYNFAFKNFGTTVKAFSFTVSATAPLPNPIDDAREFVRWQYKDFLRREPDGPGWDHWTGEITECLDAARRLPGETQEKCIDRKRTNTSGAFFLSPEFQNTGYFVLRVYRGSLGRMPHYGGGNTAIDEFTRDAATVTQGIVVNDALDPNVINANKQAFANEFVTRPEFRAIYDGLNNTAYVNKLFVTTDVTPSASDRQALIDGLNGGTLTRAKVLFNVVDGTTTIDNGGHLRFDTAYGHAFYDAQFNQAFVQMEYFGYLLRDPDSGGYAFWLAKLNQFGNFVDAEMVRAFIVSPEYRSRFGQP